jgi:hypothetical protein
MSDLPRCDLIIRWDKGKPISDVYYSEDGSFIPSDKVVDALSAKDKRIADLEADRNLYCRCPQCHAIVVNSGTCHKCGRTMTDSEIIMPELEIIRLEAELKFAADAAHGCQMQALEREAQIDNCRAILTNRINRLELLLRDCHESEIHDESCALVTRNGACTCLTGRIQKALTAANLPVTEQPTKEQSL